MTALVRLTIQYNSANNITNKSVNAQKGGWFPKRGVDHTNRNCKCPNRGLNSLNRGWSNAVACAVRIKLPFSPVIPTVGFAFLAAINNKYLEIKAIYASLIVSLVKIREWQVTSSSSNFIHLFLSTHSNVGFLISTIVFFLSSYCCGFHFPCSLLQSTWKNWWVQL